MKFFFGHRFSKWLSFASYASRHALIFRASVALMLMSILGTLYSCKKSDSEQQSPTGPDISALRTAFANGGYEQALLHSLGSSTELSWEPEWQNWSQKANESGAQYFYVPLTPKLRSQSTHRETAAFKLLGAKSFLLIKPTEKGAKFSLATCLFTETQPSSVRTSDADFYATFTGTEVLVDLATKKSARIKYENGVMKLTDRQIAARQTSASTAKGSAPLSTNGTSATNDLVCTDTYTCYWSGYCSIDGINYGTITTSEYMCMTPVNMAGQCYYVNWVQTGSDYTQECHYDNPDYGGGLPTNAPSDPSKPCPGDPINNSSLAPSRPGNYLGGTYGNVRRRADGSLIFHDGMDLAAAPGTPCVAALSGVVTAVRSSFAPGQYAANSYGNYVEIKSAVDGTYFKYNHLDAVAAGLVVGARINQGTQIGTTGTTGNAASAGVVPHLHLQVKDANYQRTDPQPHIKTKFNTSTGVGQRPC
jgi:hypothetical protein